MPNQENSSLILTDFMASDNLIASRIFRGKGIPEGRKSLAYAFTYRSPEKTLTDAEVNAAHIKIVEALKLNLGATVRE